MTALTVPWGTGAFERVLVFGMGLSGRAAAQFLLRRGVAVVGVDRRAAADLQLGELAGAAGFELRAGDELERLPDGLDAVVVSPGVPADKPLLVAARRVGLPVLAEVELAFPFLDGPVVAITGSNGKSTTTALAGALLRAAGHAVEVCGNIGTPLVACVDGAPGRVFVVELSSFQLEGTVTFRPRAAALLNISPDHLDRHGSLEAYARAKRRIFALQGEGDTAVLNADDPWVAQTALGAGRRRLFSSASRVDDGCFVDGGAVLEATGSGLVELFAVDDLPLAGAHNLENAMAAALLARAIGITPERLRAGLRDFRGLPHRMERVLERDGVVWYDDSKGTNLGATAKSLAGFPDGSVHLILGGRNKGADPRELRAIVGRKAAHVYFIGESAPEFAAALGDVAPSEIAGTLARAVESMASRVAPGQSAVLSPACASFDQFRDFNDRGDEFQRLVRALTARGDGAERTSHAPAARQGALDG